LDPEKIVISPGPCTPNESGISLDAVKYFGEKKIPILGVCLGHQCIASAYGGKIVKADNVMHGKTSAIHHHSKGVFSNLPTPFNATRYNSLLADQQTFPDCLDITAWTETSHGEMGEIMGLRHRSLPIEGVQFHPESILTEEGLQLLSNFLAN